MVIDPSLDIDPLRGTAACRWRMGRTNIDIDEDACCEVMRRYHLATKR